MAFVPPGRSIPPGIPSDPYGSRPPVPAGFRPPVPYGFRSPDPTDPYGSRPPDLSGVRPQVPSGYRSPEPLFDPGVPGIHWFGPGGAGVAYPPHLGPVGGVGGPVPMPGQPMEPSQVPAFAHDAQNIQNPFIAAFAHEAAGMAPPAGFNAGGPEQMLHPDHQAASNIASHLQNALSMVRDPELKKSLSGALATLHKHLAQRDKENFDALAGKLSARHMRESIEHAAHGRHLESHSSRAAHAAHNAYLGHHNAQRTAGM